MGGDFFMIPSPCQWNSFAYNFLTIYCAIFTINYVLSYNIQFKCEPAPNTSAWRGIL